MQAPRLLKFSSRLVEDDLCENKFKNYDNSSNLENLNSLKDSTCKICSVDLNSLREEVLNKFKQV